MKEEINIHNQYLRGELKEEDVGHNPFSLFEKWLIEAFDAKIPEPNAMTLSTIGKDNRPSSRIVLLRDYTYKGFVFYTNYKSRKGKDLKHHEYAALNFFWPQLERQVRIEGKVEKLDENMSDIYFQSRPYESQIAALISPQSEKISSRQELLSEFDKVLSKKEDIKRPHFWGGYLLIPDKIEFWQGREHRLHDRILFEKKKDKWKVSRLAP
ncbi:MAG TPA: pyridoxamine 5'-phosphate oxidase [Bacteroidia bacterium]|nr:pyridoxamine 5'-phosphate oxidase [Sphingobacteriales bacterium]HPD66376.1 pyridoxamine 5'-phosphate oxidase [Bacteroidia bacterium]HRS59972.1 pyridoxamine 5'-phosphate oxidase [Bacteroidia bacterium]HRU69004.1 pyridoxamine 5'-phosphate oxidase [Bacteroidia bacterium]